MVSCKRVSATEKLGFAAIGGLFFFLISQPALYQLTNKLFGQNRFVLIKSSGVPSILGLLVHTVVFTLLTFLIMQPWKKETYSCDGKPAGM